MVEVAQMPSAHLSHMEAVEGAAETMRVLAKQVEALSSQVLVLPSRMSCILDEAMQRSSDLIKEEIRTAIEKQNTFQQAAIARLHSDTVRASVEALRCQTEEDESHPAKGVQQIVQRIEAKEFLHQMRDIGQEWEGPRGHGRAPPGDLQGAGPGRGHGELRKQA